MSKHLFNTQHEGREVTVDAGFNGGLMGGFYLNVYETASGPMEGGIYSSLMERGGLPEVEDVEDKLNELGITVEAGESFYQALFDDASNRMGNVITRWQGGQPTQIYPEPVA